MMDFRDEGRMLMFGSQVGEAMDEACFLVEELGIEAVWIGWGAAV